MKVKTILFSLLAVGILTGAVFGAAATLTINGVDELGSNSAPVAANNQVDDVSWTIDATDITKVTGVSVSFNGDKASGTEICVKVSGDNVCVTLGAILANASSQPFVFSAPLSASAITSIDVTYAEPIP